jgi:cell filamentation protein
MTDRYDTSHLPEDQYESGSNNTVLRNKQGIIDPVAMGEAETNALWSAQEKLFAEIAADHTFTAVDICEIHRKWLKGIYSWAGKPRSVNIGKGGFEFAQARFIPTLLDEFEQKQLKPYTPCNFTEMGKITLALAEVHVELMLIHPFREGNGRLGRMLATLMALQAGLPILDFSDWDGEKRETYFAAVRAGLNRDYAPMQKLFAEVIETSQQTS